MTANARPMVLVLMGVSGCGKSTTGTRLSKLLGWPFRDADSFHPQSNIDKMSKGLPLTDEDRQPWLAAIAAWIDERLSSNQSGIVSCSALKRSYRRVIVSDRPDVRLVYLKGDMALIGDRISRRKNHFMPPALLKSQFDALEEPQADEHALSVPIVMPPRRVVDSIVQQLGITLPAQG
ncbi:MAG TPA: gluconokinase [Hyphomicrobiaceae bacterium]|nr:gluconokinase [Hyphomicrobiaceae bacterium]